MKDILPERFKDKVDQSGECWKWTARKSDTGYGECSSGGKKVRVHRFMWIYTNGEIPNGLHVLHKCDVRNCVNPDHLFLGTHQDNMVDKLKKDRNHRPIKEKNGRTKLTQLDADEIRRIYKRGKGGIKSEFSTIGLAKKYGVGSTAINDIINNVRWISIV